VIITRFFDNINLVIIVQGKQIHTLTVPVNSEREEVIRILNHLRMWPIEYPKPAAIDARASPLDLKLLEKLAVYRHLK
jgi:hypothetical protein